MKGENYIFYEHILRLSVLVCQRWILKVSYLQALDNASCLNILVVILVIYSVFSHVLEQIKRDSSPKKC